MNVIIAGVGGQGNVFLASILAEAIEGKVKFAKIFGEAQRKGSVSCHLRVGDMPSPVIPYGQADILALMNKDEEQRNQIFLKSDAKIVFESDNMKLLAKLTKLMNLDKEKIIERLKARRNSDANIKKFLMAYEES